ncbi:Y-family DNA polymerase [Desulfovibrio sp. OttesenSCG-928-F20]|nr:Y-family DNA polymerase [Desulfovibrio sp. OttesenSCG-928-F20]
MFSTRSKPLFWGLVDCNSFYCSCERLFRPDLEGRLVVVLSNNDGCLIALTPEAKALGFKMGEVYFQVKRHLKRLGVTVFSSNYTLYGDISNRVMRTIETLVPIEQYSIDECFVSFYPATAVQALDVGWAIHDRVRQWVGVPVRVGIGPTRTLAKLANLWAKKRTRVFKLDLGSPELEEVLEATPTGDIWGIGCKQSAKLERIGIRNARQLRDMDQDWALKLMTVVGQRTVLELRGFQCIMEDQAPVPRKTLINSRSFGKRVTKKEDLAQAVTMHCTIAGERLRLERMEAAGLCVHMQTSMHTEEPYFSTSASVSIPIPTNSTAFLIKAAMEALDKCYQPGHGYMKGGILLYDLQEQGSRQLTLMEAAAYPKQQRNAKLMQTLDTVNDRFGRGTLRYLSQGPAEAHWHMTRNLLSGALTTRWSELAKAKA